MMSCFHSEWGRHLSSAVCCRRAAEEKGRVEGSREERREAERRTDRERKYPSSSSIDAL